MIINCKVAAKLECISLDRPLTRGEQLRLKLHHWLCKCPVCCAHKDQLDCFEKSIGTYRESMECCKAEHRKRLCREARERICKKMHEEMDTDSE